MPWESLAERRWGQPEARVQGPLVVVVGAESERLEVLAAGTGGGQGTGDNQRGPVQLSIRHRWFVVYLLLMSHLNPRLGHVPRGKQVTGNFGKSREDGDGSSGGTGAKGEGGKGLKSSGGQGGL